MGGGSSHTVLPRNVGRHRLDGQRAMRGEVVVGQEAAAGLHPGDHRPPERAAVEQRPSPARTAVVRQSARAGLRTMSPTATGAPAGTYSGPSTGSAPISAAARRRPSRASGGPRTRPGRARSPAARRSASDRVPKRGERVLEQAERAGHRRRGGAAGGHGVEPGGGQRRVVERQRQGARPVEGDRVGRRARHGSGSRRHPVRTAAARRRTARAPPPRPHRSRWHRRRAVRRRPQWRGDRTWRWRRHDVPAYESARRRCRRHR